jgi:hypothetical protein
VTKLYAKRFKCIFYIIFIEFFGFIVNIKGVLIDFNKIDSIFTWLIFKSFKNVQIFFNFANFYKRFIKGYSEIAGFLTNLLKESELDKKKKLIRISL